MVPEAVSPVIGLPEESFAVSCGWSIPEVASQPRWVLGYNCMPAAISINAATSYFLVRLSGCPIVPRAIGTPAAA
ncbi:MAG TPA: hypothetical protein DEF68_09530 [Elusimicrobia bacterium]|nr:hypothetical protein [Elusimicrobiota bacterium]